MVSCVESAQPCLPVYLDDLCFNVPRVTEGGARHTGSHQSGEELLGGGEELAYAAEARDCEGGQKEGERRGRVRGGEG